MKVLVSQTIVIGSMILSAIQGYAGSGQIGSANNNNSVALERFDACTVELEQFIQNNGNGNATIPFVERICIMHAQAQIDLDSTKAMLSRGSTNQVAIETGQSVINGQLDKETLLKLLSNQKLRGPTPRQIAFEISPLIQAGKVEEECLILNIQNSATNQAIQFCSK